MPKDQGEELRALWDEFETYETADAKYAHLLDNFQPLLLNDASGGISWIEHAAVSYTHLDVYKRQIHFRAAANYIQSGHYAEALNVLNTISQRNGLWYYYSAVANYGTGNNVTALEHAKEAVRLEPNNLQYQMFLQRMEGGSGWYQGQQSMYGFPTVGSNDFCMKLCIANIMCNLFCGGGMCCGGTTPGGRIM